MVRINDKIAELELQVDPLREQAEKAKKYLVLRDELRLLEISVWLENLDALKAGARKLEADFRAAEEARDKARADLDALYAEGEQYSEKMREKDLEAERIRADSAALEEKIREKESAAAVLESTVAHKPGEHRPGADGAGGGREPLRRPCQAGGGAGGPGGGDRPPDRGTE